MSDAVLDREAATELGKVGLAGFIRLRTQETREPTFLTIEAILMPTMAPSVNVTLPSPFEIFDELTFGAA